MTPEQEYQQAVRELNTIRSSYDAARGAMDGAVAAITALYPDVTTLAEAEALLTELTQTEETKRNEFLGRLREFRQRYIAKPGPAN